MTSGDGVDDGIKEASTPDVDSFPAYTLPADVPDPVELLLAEREGGALARALSEAFPWVRFLPAGAVRQLLSEFVEVARVGTESGTIGPILQMLTEWKHTVETYGDPDLYAVLRADHGDSDHGEVVPSEVAGE